MACISKVASENLMGKVRSLQQKRVLGAVGKRGCPGTERAVEYAEGVRCDIYAVLGDSDAQST